MGAIARIVVAAAVVASAVVSSGCSLIGAGIGSVVPRYETVDAQRRVELGEDVRVLLLDGDRVDGRYEGIRAGLLSLTVEGQAEPREIALTEIAELRVRNGSHWSTGLLIGGAVDVTLVIAATVAASQWESGMHFEIGSFR